MELTIDIYRGAAIVHPWDHPGATGFRVPLGDFTGLATAFARHFRTLLIPANVVKPKGTRGFSFHWSNAFATWDAKPWNDAMWHTDGAEFLVYFTRNALSPSGGPWSKRDMEMVARKLPEHPGYASSPESSQRVADRFLRGGV